MTANNQDNDNNEEGGTERPPPQNPFDESAAADDSDSLIKGKRTAAVSGTLIGLLLAVLVAGICILGAIAFAD